MSFQWILRLSHQHLIFPSHYQQPWGVAYPVYPGWDSILTNQGKVPLLSWLDQVTHLKAHQFMAFAWPESTTDSIQDNET